MHITNTNTYPSIAVGYRQSTSRFSKLGLNNSHHDVGKPSSARSPFPKAASSHSESETSLDIDSPSSDQPTIDFEQVVSAEKSIAHQQASGLPPPYNLTEITKIVETAMLAAVAGLAYTIATLLKLEGYLSYALPLPVVIASLRGGVNASIKCLIVAFLLLFSTLALMGPIRAITYLCSYGFLSLALGLAFSLRLPWLLSVPIGTLARFGGQMSYVALSSWVANENLLALLISNAHAVLDQLSVYIGASGSPSFTTVAVALCSSLIVNCLFYVFLMHILYTLILRGMGYSIGDGPKFLSALLKKQAAFQTR